MSSKRGEQDKVEKRGAFRCGVQTPRQGGVLQVGGVEIPVQLLDESAGGFAVLADRDPGVEVNDIVGLRTDAGWHEVRVARMSSEPTTAEAGRRTDAARPGTRLGLERLRDLEPWEASRRWMSWRDRLRVAGFFPLGKGNVLVGVIFASVITVGLVAIAILLCRSDQGFTMLATGLSQPAHPSPRAESTRRPEAGASREEGTPSEGPSSAPDSVSERKLASDDSTRGSSPPPGRPAWDRTIDEAIEVFYPASGGAPSSSLAYPPSREDEPWRTMVRRLPGAAAFLVKEVVQELGLTEQQVGRMERLVELTGEAIGQIPVRWPHETRWQHDAKRQILVAEARRRALEVLTEEQRARWETLQAEAAVEPGDAE